MKAPVAAALVGFALALLPWLPSCPARIAAADLPPPPPRGNFSAGGGSPSAASAAQAGGASSNAVLGAEKPEARSILPVNDPSNTASNCTEGTENCSHIAPAEHSEDTARNATRASPGSPVAVVSREDEKRPEGVPLPAGSEISSEPTQGVEDNSAPDTNGIEGTSSTGASGTAALIPDSSSPSVPSEVSRPQATLPSTTTGRGFGSAVEGNHVFSSTPEGLVSPRVTASRMAAAGDTDVTDVKETSAPEATEVAPETSTPEAAKDGKAHKETKHEGKGGEKEDEVHEDGPHEETGDNDEEMDDGEDESWDGMGSVHEERSTGHGDVPQEHTTDGDGVSLYYRQFTRMESQDFEEPGTTRSYVTVEKSSKLDYSSSVVVSEVYDSESPPEEDSVKDPPRVHDDSETKKNESSGTSSPLDANDVHSVEEETSDSPEYMEEDKLEENVDAESSQTTTTVPDLKVSKDQDPASSASGGKTAARAQPSRGPARTRPPPISTTTERDPGTEIPTRKSEITRKRNGIDKERSEANGASSPTDAPPLVTTTSVPTKAPLKEINRSRGSVTFHSVASTTHSYSPRTSRRLYLSRSSTTESPVKNEVTYNENVTGPTYDFKANISLTTPMAHLMLTTAPATSTVSPGTEKRVQIQLASPTISQTTDQSMSEALLVSTIVTPSTTEAIHVTTEQVDAEDTQGRGNSINDWTTVGTSENTAPNREAESMTEPASPSGTKSYDSTTSSPVSSSATSTVLFTTVQNASASDLVIENMSVSSNSEESASVTVSSSTAAESESDSISERVAADVTERFVVENDSSSPVSPVSVMSPLESTQLADNVTTSSIAYGTSSSATLATEFESSTSSDLHPYKVKTKVPPVSLVDTADTNVPDYSSKEGGINETFTVQPMSATASQNPTLSPEDISSTSSAAKDSSSKTTFTPIVVMLNSSSIVGTTDASYKTSTASTGTTRESELPFITYPWHVRLGMKISWSEICHGKQQFSLKQALAQLISSAMITTPSHSALSIDRVLLLNFAKSCPNVSGSPSEVHFCILSAVAESSNERAGRELEDVKGATVVHCDAALMQLFLNIWDKAPKPMEEPLTHVKEVGIAHSGMDLPANPSEDNTGVQAAIGISCIAAVALFLLAALLIIMRRRQRRFNYGQRCTPVSLDAYSLDSVSVREGSRRGRGQARNGDVGRRGVNGGLSKADGLNDWRASKRSYGNPAFEDDDGEEVLLSKPMNFATLTNAALDEEGALADEFRLIPKRFHKRTVRRKSRSRYKDPAAVAERGEGGGSKDEDDDERLPEGAEEKNRYANVVPLPSTRVRLSARPSGPLSTYINANFVRGPKNEERFYIACQAPLQSTIEDFWRMIWEQQSKVVLMLTNLVENSVEKCADYLPPSEVLDCHRLFGDFQVTLKKREVREKYIVSNLQLKNMESNLWREVTHLWFLGWPDQGVPEEPNQVIAFLIEARSFVKTNPGPTVVHCSPGTGRTGTVISIDICIREFEQSRMIDVPKVVQQLRRDREGAVQTQQQYTFIYKALSLYAAKLTGGAMDSF